MLKKLKYQSIPEWDSVGHMSMISALEDTFKITMDMDDIIDFSSYEFGKKILKKYKVIIK
jgi:acyl carrier protein